MSDTITCPNCSATLPAAASFCTSCGNRLSSTPPPPVTFAPPGTDATRVDGPAPGDATSVYGAPLAAPAAPPPPTGMPPGPSSVPWQPAAPAESGGSWANPAPPPPTTQTPAWTPPPQQPGVPTGAPPAAWPGAATAGAPAKATGAGSPLGAALAILGGVLTLVGIFMPWVTNNLSDNGLSGWDLTSGDKGFLLPDQTLLTFDSLDPYLLLALGALGILVGVMALGGGMRSLSRVLGAVVGIAIVGVMIRDWTSLAQVVEQGAPASFEIQSAVGFYLAIAGGALVAVSAAMPSKGNGN